MGPLTRLLGRVVRFGDNSGTAATLLISPQPKSHTFKTLMQTSFFACSVALLAGEAAPQACVDCGLGSLLPAAGLLILPASVSRLGWCFHKADLCAS